MANNWFIFLIFAVVMKIFTSAQIKELDRFTIENEPIPSIDLMERAAKALTRAITEVWNNAIPVVVFAGPGNNGGDALAVARMLGDQGYQVSVYLFNISGHLAEECAANKRKLVESKHVKDFTEVSQEFDPPRLEKGMLVVDGLFGSGLNKPLAGGFASLVKYINASAADIVSIDVPSGLMTEDNTYNVRANIIKATLTLTLQQPKLSFYFQENQPFIGQLRVLDIRLSQEGINKIEANYTVVEEAEVRSMLLGRDPFSHKGQMGHALLVAGSYGMAGAAILSARACLRSGVGKITIHTPKKNREILQIAVPEAVLQFDPEETIFSEAVDTEDFQALGIGPGIGQSETTAIPMITQLRRATCPIVADADALNIISQSRYLMEYIPAGSILTPHPGELRRLTGDFRDPEDMIDKAIGLATENNITVVVKGAPTVTVSPAGTLYVNTTGNPGMATGGSGDVLTGMVLALLAQGYTHDEAAFIAVYMHGLAGDIAARRLSMTAMTSADIADSLPAAWLQMTETL